MMRGRQGTLLEALLSSVLLLSIAFGCDSHTNAYTSVDQVFSEPVFQYCESINVPSVRGLFDTEEMKSTGVLNRLLAEAKHPRADVFWSGDPVRVFTLLNKGLVEPYLSDNAQGLPSQFKDAKGLWTGFAARARVLLVNTDIVPVNALPESVEDLIAPQWKKKTAIANPLFGTTTMHFAALFAHYGQQRGEEFLQQLLENQTIVASSNGEVKRLVVSGEVAWGLTDTDDAQQAVASGAPVRVVYPDQKGMGTVVMPSVVVLVKNAPHPAAGKRLIDCLLSGEVEKRMAENGAHMPLRTGVATAKGLTSVSSLRSMNVNYAQLAQTMQQIEPTLRKWVGLGER